jgi:signal peptidase II
MNYELRNAYGVVFMYKRFFWILVALLIFAIDRLTKLLVLQHLALNQPHKIFPFLDFFLTYNTGAAFSFLNRASGWQNLFLGVLALALIMVIVVWLTQLSSRQYTHNIIWLELTLAFILGGALGNLYDRVYYGHVIDFVDFYLSRAWHWPAFNFADSAICIGSITLAILFLYGPYKKKVN